MCVCACVSHAQTRAPIHTYMHVHTTHSHPPTHAHTLSRFLSRFLSLAHIHIRRGIYTATSVWEALAYAEPDSIDMTQTVLVADLLQVAKCFVTLSRNTLQHTVSHCNTLQNPLHYTASHGNALRHTATHCNTLQRTVTHCNALQRTTTHCKHECLFSSSCLCVILKSMSSKGPVIKRPQQATTSLTWPLLCMNMSRLSRTLLFANS